MQEFFRIGTFKRFYAIKRREEILEEIMGKKALKSDNNFRDEDIEDTDRPHMDIKIRDTEQLLAASGQDDKEEFKRNFSPVINYEKKKWP